MTKTLFEHTEIAPADDRTACPSNRIPWDSYLGGRLYTDAQIDAKVGALYGNALQNGMDIAKNRALISALATAFAAHVQNHGGTAVDISRTEFDAIVADIRAAQDAIEARLIAASEGLNG